MDFNEFNFLTKKVKILSPKVSMKKYDFLYLFNPEYKGIKPVSLWGYYFPNDDQIRSLCWNNPENFMEKFKEEINIKYFENDPFEELRDFVRLKSTGIYLKEDIDSLVSIIGRAYESRTFRSADILDADIRIKALRGCPEINVIGHFEKVQLGYSGIGFAVPNIK